MAQESRSSSKTARLARQAARLAHNILVGKSPAEIPVELPTEIELVINLKTAELIGLKVQPGVLLRANRVIQ